MLLARVDEVIGGRPLPVRDIADVTQALCDVRYWGNSDIENKSPHVGS